LNIFAIGESSLLPLFKIEARLAARFIFSLGDDNGVDVDDDVADVERDRDDDKDFIFVSSFIVGVVDFNCCCCCCC
jgi:hypothetical protein